MKYILIMVTCIALINGCTSNKVINFKTSEGELLWTKEDPCSKNLYYFNEAFYSKYPYFSFDDYVKALTKDDIFLQKHLIKLNNSIEEYSCYACFPNSCYFYNKNFELSINLKDVTIPFSEIDSYSFLNIGLFLSSNNNRNYRDSLIKVNKFDKIKLTYKNKDFPVEDSIIRYYLNPNINNKIGNIVPPRLVYNKKKNSFYLYIMGLENTSSLEFKSNTNDYSKSDIENISDESPYIIKIIFDINEKKVALFPVYHASFYGYFLCPDGGWIF